jgi:hypothetical protein
MLAVTLLALRVEVVELLAGERRLASRGAAVVVTTALAPLVNSAGVRVGGVGGLRLRRLGAVALVGAADGTELDVGEGDLGVGDILLEVSRQARGCGARSSLRAELGRVSGEGRVEPEHVGVVLCIRVSIILYDEFGIWYHLRRARET